jgi:transposase
MIFQSGFKVYIAVGSVDMRKAIDGLSSLVAGVLHQDPYTGHLFAFSNRRKNMIKILYWQQNGFCLWQKRLEKGRFRWPKSSSEAMQVSGRELSWLLDGLDLNQEKAHKQLSYSKSY